MAKKKKDIGTILIVGAIVVILILVIVPGLSGSISSLLGQPKVCINAPYAHNCICPIGFDKIRKPTTPLISYECIPSIQPKPYEFPISPDDLEFNEKVFAYAKDYLNEDYSTCNTRNCESPMFKDISKIGPSKTVFTHAYIECGEPLTGTTGQYWWRVVFSLEDGTLHPFLSTYCNSK